MIVKLNCMNLFFVCYLMFFVTGYADVLKSNETENKATAIPIEQAVELKNKPFLLPEDLQDLYHELIQFIEVYDAEGIATRALTKSVDWQAYKEHNKPAFIHSTNWQQLKTAFDGLTAGFVNLHARFRFNKSLSLEPKVNLVKLGFTYPELSFFNQDTGQAITAFNQKPSEKAFSDFEQYSCSFNSQVGCLRSFISRFNRGKLMINQNPLTSFKQAGQSVKVKYQPALSARNSDRFSAIKVDQYVGWDVLVKGYKVAVLKQPGLLLLKIKDFSYQQGSGSDFRCSEPAKEQSMCADIQLMRSAFDQSDVSDLSLIIDVQNNGGGQENTAFMAELSQAPFKDLMVSYKNTPILQDEGLRKGLFYGSSRAENWFDQLSQNELDSSNEWLPARADFCRGDSTCKLKWIEPNSKRKFKAVYLLTNESCVSSCDDLVWRLNEYSAAQVYGLPQAADATYSRISATFYLDNENNIHHKIHPDGSRPDINGTVIFALTIPYSRTVTSTGQLRQGRTAPTTFLLPISANNFNTHHIDSLNYLATLVRADAL